MTPLDRQGRALSWTLDAQGLLEVTLQQEPLNEIGEASLQELELLVTLLSRKEVRAVLVLSGLPRGFCAGADLRALEAAISQRGQAAIQGEVREFLRRIHAAFRALDEVPVPTAAAVHGVVFGGGFELALCCDLIVADRTARFAFPELRLGLIPGFGGVARLSRDVGNARVRDLLLTGRSLNAESALQAGIVSQLTAPGKHVDVARRSLLQTTRLDPVALATAKRFAKPFPTEALEPEIEIFCQLLARPETARALGEFVRRTDVLPYVAVEGQT